MCVEVQPREVSSTKASPVSIDLTALLAESKVVRASRGLNEFTISVNKSNHRKGPKVEPCPGPNSGHSGVFWYDSMEMPYFVFM